MSHGVTCAFGKEPDAPILKSPIEIQPSRSPFIKERIDVMYEGDTLDDILEQVTAVQLKKETFRVYFVKINDLKESEKIHLAKRREIERSIGLQINGEPELKLHVSSFTLPVDQIVEGGLALRL